MPTIYQRKDTKTWYLFYRLNGEPIRKPIGKNKKLAEAALANFVVKLDRIKAGLEVSDELEPLSLQKFYDVIVKHIRERKSNRTYIKYLCDLNNFYTYLENENVFFTSELSIQLINRFVQHRLDNKRSSKTINEELNTMRALFNIAIDLGIVITNPFINLNSIRPPKIKVQPFFYKHSELIQIFEHITQRFEHFYNTLLYTGVRAGEFILFEWDDFDLKNNLVYVRTKAGRTESKMRTRAIPMHLKVREAYLNRKELKESDKYVFTTQSGELFKIHVLRKLWQRAVKKAGMKHGHVHHLRHTFASHVAMSGKVTLYELSKWLGHTSIKTTEIYAHLIPQKNSNILDSALDF